MCGICGWVSLGGPPPPPERLPAMLAALRHRGPDQQTQVSWQSAGLGIARLAIQDPEGGFQPYRNEDERLWAVFNGEIYNFQELRAELESRGHQLRSRADGEVIVHLFEEYGPAFVERLNGMFAIALWDGVSLHLFRDRLGIKPLYLAISDRVLYFASELKALLHAPGVSRRLDHRALRSYLTLEYVPAPHSMFAAISKLEPAHHCRAGEHGVERRRYWEFPEWRPSGGSLSEWVERLRALLEDSVRLRRIADVPIGVFLSGGLDSSTLTSMMSRLHDRPVHTFSVGFAQASFDESAYSRAVSEHLQTVHHHQQLEPQSMLEALEPLVAQLDEPLADPAVVPTYLLARFAREWVTVALSGEGADELLGGYPTYFAHQLAAPFDVLPQAFWRWLGRQVGRLPASSEYLSWEFRLKKFVSGMGLPLEERHLTWMGAFPWAGDSGVLREPAPHALDLSRWSKPGTVVERAQSLDLRTYLVDDLLVKLDRATMAVSLEGRVPFLDHRLVEAMSALPTSWKLRGLEAKRTLRQVEGARLPASVIGRRKKGFGVPLTAWLKGPLRPLVETYLGEPYLRRQGLFRPEVVARLVDQHGRGQADHRKPLWTLLCFQRWAEHYRATF